MHLLTTASLLALALGFCPYSQLTKREDNIAASAESKLAETWSNLVKTKGTSGEFYFAGPIRLLAVDMRPTMEYQSDTVPPGKKKFIHSVGVVSKAVFEPAPDSIYTGLFQGSKNMIIRPSMAGAPSGNQLTPGVAFKMFRTGRPSANFVAMWSLDGQDSFNFFEHEFSNHVPIGNVSGALKIGKKKFGTVSKWPGFVGLSDIASFNEDGSAVAKPVFPFQLVLKPKYATPKDDDGSGEIYDKLAAIKSGTLLWDVYANDCPLCKFKFIGSIKTASEMIRSSYGDTELFFRHQRFDDDFKLRPEWEKQCSVDTDCDSCIGTNSCEYEQTII